MITLHDAHGGPDSAYYGENPGWLICPNLGTHRDADALTRSNYAVLEQRLRDSDGDEETWHEELSGHWAVGWVTGLAVEPGTAAAQILAAAESDIEDYPVLDEEHFSALENGEAVEHWDSLTLSSRVDWLKERGESIFAARADYYELLDRAPYTAEAIRSG